MLWPPDAKNWLTGKDTNAGKDWRQEEKGKTEDEIVGWHHQLNGHEFEQAPGVGDGQGGLACSSPWGCSESDTTEWLNWTELTRAGMSSTWSFDCLSPHSRDLSLTGSLRTLSRHRNEPHQWKSAVNGGRRTGGSRSISYFSRKYIYILTDLQLDEWPVSGQQGMIFELKSHPLADSACPCSCPKCDLQSVSALLPFLSFFN